MNTSLLSIISPSIGLLLGRADLDLLSPGAILLRNDIDRVPLLVIHLLDQLSNTEELVHLLKSQTLLIRVLVRTLVQDGEWMRLTLVSGTRNQTKKNMLKQKQEKVMNAP